MLSEGDRAPEFELQGTTGEGIDSYRLSDYTDGGVLVSFYPFDFAPSCTEEVCGLRDTEWFTFVDDLDVLAISTDGPYAHMEFIDRYDLDFPLLSDTNAQVADSYGAVHDQWQGFDYIIQRATFLIDAERTIRHVTALDNPLLDPELGPVRRAVQQLDG